MRIQPEAIEIDSWPVDEEWGRSYPEGARAKRLLISPERVDWNGIRPNWRYLFKRSDKRYPEQLWGEVIAYQIGLMLDIPVPPAHAAYSASSGQCAALIEWFYEQGKETFVPAGAIFQRLSPDFDREKGKRHNLVDAFRISRVLVKKDWREGLADMMVLDCLIGNTDRHQENWGFLFDSKQGTNKPARFAPWFDNGTSMGCERWPDQVASWNDERLAKYVNKGCLHLRPNMDSDERIPHMTLLEVIVRQNDTPLKLVRERFAKFEHTKLEFILSELEKIEMPERLSPERSAWISRLINFRAKKMKEILL